MNRRTFLSIAAASAASAAEQPLNVILIYADDLGYGDLGCYGSKIRTPNLDRMAAEGVRFTNFLSANPVCSPSRAALLTGRYPTRVSMHKVLFPTDTTGLPPAEKTLANLLKDKGYQTMCIGKWHLGHAPEHLPMAHGFDRYFGIPYSNDMAPRVLLRNTETVEQTADLPKLTGRYTDEAVRFIEGAKGSPFFLYMPHTYPHIPLGASERFRGKSPLGLYGDVVEELDWSVGQVLETLKRNKLERNTLVLFSSDNGPWFEGSPGALRGRKGTTYEGGVREPFIARLPGRIPSGKVCSAVASTMDILPTVAKLCGAAMPALPLDGVDIWPLLSGAQKELDREALLYFDGWNLQCIRRGKWKLHISRYNTHVYGPLPAAGRANLALLRPELYDLEMDPQESYDVSDKNPDVVRELQSSIDKLLPGFPEEVGKAYAETQKRKSKQIRPGALPN